MPVSGSQSQCMGVGVGSVRPPRAAAHSWGRAGASVWPQGLILVDVARFGLWTGPMLLSWSKRPKG